MISFVRPSNSAAPWAKWLIGYSCRGNPSEFYVCKGKVVNLDLIATGLVRGWMSVHPRPCWRRLVNCEINVCNNTHYMYTNYCTCTQYICVYIYIYTHNGKRYKTSLASSALFFHCHCVVALCYTGIEVFRNELLYQLPARWSNLPRWNCLMCLLLHRKSWERMRFPWGCFFLTQHLSRSSFFGVLFFKNGRMESQQTSPSESRGWKECPQN